MAHRVVAVRTKQEVEGEEHTRPGRTYMPDVDICETADGLWLWADMPGVDEESVHVNVADGVLTVEGHVVLKDYENLTPVYTEYNVGNYMRRFSLSRDIDTEQIKAHMVNGALELELPKSATSKPRRVVVTAG